MASSRDRQRKLARAKLDRQLARRAAAAKRRRQIRAGVGAAVVLVLIVAGSAWALGAFDSEPEKQAAEDVCLWTAQDGAVNTNLKDVGEPPTTGLPTSGTRPMTITTNQGGPITVELDQTDAPCGAASLSYLAGRSFFDNTTCHEITAEGALRCGDPTGTGLGGPTYSFFDENVPAAPEPSPSASPAPGQPATYPKGTVAMIGNPPGSNGSQFLIFFKDASPEKPAYSVVGKVTGGLDVVEKIGAMPTEDNGNGAKVKPKTQILVQSVTVGEPGAALADSPAPSPSASAG
ncbi:peptidylprolyl isomerase [Micromonospora sp. CMU55-4]|uniref:peptidylprolyl isomerase n=1 Tax=Micromonospora sp. CMU55-4 TaxID=2717028 RepID=UPI00140DDAB0|nr:peptidylprolyl isomerase [Micromonospora sp. CMU55-4]NHO81619.1 peptidylprolyl isomerase [Micromonospora sp. CMU55-4]